MNAKEVRALLQLAKSTTLDSRAHALRSLLNDARVEDGTRAQLHTLLEETERARATTTKATPEMFALRPKVAPNCLALSPLQAGDEPLLEDDTRQVIDEWTNGWKAAESLHAAGVPTPGPLLLYGQPGLGKTTTTKYIASLMVETRATVVLDAHAMEMKFLGEAGATIHKAFSECAATNALLVIEELDAFSTHRTDPDGHGAGTENIRISVAIMRMLDSYAEKMPVVATTNRRDLIDAALLRRFEYQVQLEKPPVPVLQKIFTRHLAHDVTADDIEWIRTHYGDDLNQMIPLMRRARRGAHLRGNDPLTVLKELLAGASW